MSRVPFTRTAVNRGVLEFMFEVQYAALKLR
jgi:hypothetical protein